MSQPPSKAHNTGAETRRRILETARKLFSLHGFEGTSVRDIARESQVNLSSINYHFKSKDSLYWALIVDMHLTTHENMRELAAESTNISQFSRRVLGHLLDDAEFVRSILKLMMTEMRMTAEAMEAAHALSDQFGPPGSEFFNAFIQQEFHAPLDLGEKRWAVDVIFNHIIQSAMLNASPFCKIIPEGFVSVTREQLMQDIDWVVQATLNFLRTQPASSSLDLPASTEPGSSGL